MQSPHCVPSTRRINMASRYSSRIHWRENDKKQKEENEKKQLEFARSTCKQKIDAPGFDVKFINEEIGYGVFANQNFKEGEFLLEYRGDLVPIKEAKRRERMYEETEAGSFLYRFKNREKQWCVDATNNIFDKGRMINDAEHGSKEENTCVKIVLVNKQPHLCIFAIKDIRKGEELRYDYGIADLPWRKKSVTYTKTIQTTRQHVACTNEGQSKSPWCETEDDNKGEEDMNADGANMKSPWCETEDDNKGDEDMNADGANMKSPWCETEDENKGDEDMNADGTNMKSPWCETEDDNIGDEDMNADGATKKSPWCETEDDKIGDEDMNADGATKKSPWCETEDDDKGDEDMNADGATKKSPWCETEDDNKGDDDMNADGATKKSPWCETKDDNKGDEDMNADGANMKSPWCETEDDNKGDDDMNADGTTKKSPWCETEDGNKGDEDMNVDGANMKSPWCETEDDNIGDEDVNADSATKKSPWCETEDDNKGDEDINADGANMKSPWCETEDDNKGDEDMNADGANMKSPWCETEDDNIGDDDMNADGATKKCSSGATEAVNKRAEDTHEDGSNIESPWCETEDDNKGDEDMNADGATKKSDNISTERVGKRSFEDESIFQGLTCTKRKPNPPRNCKVSRRNGSNSEHDLEDECIEDSCDEYKPEDESEDESEDDGSSDTSEIIDKQPNAAIPARQNINVLYQRAPLTSDNTATVPIPARQNINILYQRAPTSDNTATVPTTNNKSERKYDKKYFCMYCEKSYAKLPRHLNEKHKDEEYVIEYRDASNKDTKKKILEKIRNIGNHLHNREVLLTGKGQLFVKYRPTEAGANTNDFSPCPYCFAYFRTKDLWRHKCQMKPEKGQSTMRITAASKLLLPNKSGSSEHLHAVLSGMRSDPVSRITKSDETIRLFGEKLCNKLAHDEDQYNYIRQKMRELARLVEELRIKDDAPNKFLKDFIDPTYYSLVVTACKSITSFDQISNKYGTPSLALKIGHSLGKCGKLLIGLAIQNRNKEQQEKAEEFLKLLQMSWADDISSNAIRTLHEAKKNTGMIVPLAQDVATLMKYLKSASADEYNTLNKSGDEDLSQSWIRLTQILLVLIISFNRRRSGGVSKMKLSEYESISKSNVNDAIEGSLSAFERKLSRAFYRLEITVKRGNIVPILLTENMKKHLDLLVKLRPKVVANTNPYMFPRINYGSMSHLKGCECLRKLADECGAQEPDKLYSTSLRKHIATMSQILNLSENELDILARFMGHDIKVHREYYRLPDETLQIAKVSKLLLRMEKGGYGLAAGQTLDSIDLQDNELAEESGESEADDDSSDESNEAKGADDEDIVSNNASPVCESVCGQFEKGSARGPESDRGKDENKAKARAEETGVPLELIPSPQSKLEKELEKKNTMEAMWYGITPSLLKRLKSTSASVNDILQHGVEENYHVRVMVVGKEGVGKSTLTRRLIQLPVDIRQYNSTDGIDVHIHTCEVDLDSGVWSHRDLGVFDKIKSVFGIQTKEKLRYVSPGGSRDFHQRLAQVLQSHTQAQTSNSDDLPTLIPSSNLKPFEDKETETDNKRNVKKEDYISKNRSSADSDQLSEATHQDDIEKTLRKAKTLKSERRGRKATISFYDFAGQEIFQASHPTFLSSKAIYILAFKLQNLWEMSRSLETSSPTEKTKLKEADSSKESIVFWLNVIYMFASIKTDIQPHVLLVGTHADKLPSKDRETIIKQCFDEFRNSIVDSPFNNILAKIEYAVDNTRKSNPVYSQLKNKIFELAKSLPNWGEKTPSKWLPLDREIQYLKESGHKVLSLKQLREINSSLEIGVSSDAEMTIFLQFLHDTGEIIYFSEEGLKDTIVLDPVWMIDALKTIITAERFSIRKPRLNVLWKDFRKSGVICKSAIVTIFEGNVSDRSLFENHEHMIRLMEKFLFIASPVSFPEDETTIGAIGGEEQADISYIMPCMVNKEADKDLITNEEGKSSTTVLCMIPATNFLPPAVFHKLLAMCITKWPIVEQRGQKLIFFGICKFNIDKYRLYKLTVFQVKYAVHAKIDSFVDDKQPDPAVCQPVMEFLTRSMTSVLQAMGFSAEFKTCIQCPQFSAAELGGYLDTDLTINQNYITCDDCSSSHALEKRDLLGCWIETEPKEKDELLSQASRDTFPADANADQENSAKTIRLEGPHDIELEHDDPLIEDAPITQEHLNHARLCNALVTVCADALREILLTQIPPGYPNFYQLLLAKEAALRGMRQFRQEQIGILYPDPHNRYPGTVDQFDITLLYALIRNVSAVVPPGTGWGQPPDDNPRDTSLGASVERIRRFRNTVVGHSVDYKVDQRTFEDTWNEIRQTIDDIENVIGDKGYEMALRERKNQAFTLEEARMLQRKFKDTLLSADESLEELQKTIDGIRKKIKTAVGEVC